MCTTASFSNMKKKFFYPPNFWKMICASEVQDVSFLSPANGKKPIRRVHGCHFKTQASSFGQHLGHCIVSGQDGANGTSTFLFSSMFLMELYGIILLVIERPTFSCLPRRAEMSGFYMIFCFFCSPT